METRVEVFTISQEPKRYLTYVLNDTEGDSQIKVVPERGAIISRWKVNNQDILYLDEERFANPELSIRGGIPILFPICGNLPNNTYKSGDREYQLKQHGVARDLPWEVTETNTDHLASITLTLDSNQDTLAVYPFAFKLTFTYQLQGNSLKILQNYTNLSNARMPFSAGLHPYFLVKDKSQLSFDIPSYSYFDHISGDVKSFSGEFDFERDEIDSAFTSIDKHHTTIVDGQRNSKMTIHYSDFYSTLVFWTIKGKDYVCLEPWSAPRNAMNTKEQLNYIEPGSSYDSVVEMIWEKD
ncbi:MAG: aldose epimerase [Xenococcaceae cyanobacterium MO_188.B19]|nr:aldose epimerase [Xenococcaceae cyanobacterium MO_188.B19]